MKKLFIIFVMLQAMNASGQWVQTNGPNGGYSEIIQFANGYLYAGTLGAGVFRSIDNGNTWTKVLDYATGNYVSDIAPHGQYVFVSQGTNLLYRSSDNGNSWVAISVPVTVKRVVSSGQYIITSGYKIFRSSNNGDSWDSCNVGLPSSVYYYSLNVIGSNVYAGTRQGAFVSTNSGTNWVSINNGINTQTVLKIGSDGNSLYACTSNGVYKSTNSGVQWFLINNGLPVNWFYDFSFDGSYIFATTLNGMYRSSNGGLNWETCNNGLLSLAVSSYKLSGSKLFCVSLGGAGIQYTSNHGSLWEISNNGFYAFNSNSLATINNYIFTCSGGQGLAVSSNDGISWLPVYNLLIDRYVNCVSANSNFVFVCNSTTGILKSTDYGLNWLQCNNGITDPGSLDKLYAFDDVVFASSYSLSFRTTNNGDNWSLLSSPGNIESIARIGDVFIAGSSNIETGGLFRSSNKGLNWSYVNQSYLPVGIISKDSVFYFKSINGFYKSTNLGVNWTSFTTDFTGEVQNMSVLDNKIVLFTSSNIYTSSNNGVNWVNKSQGLPAFSYGITRLIIKGDNVFIGISSNGVWKRSKLNLLSISNITNEIPVSYSLYQNYPNPFNPTTKIKFDIARFPSFGGVPEGRGGLVTLKVYDITGREVQTLVNERLHPGTYEATFDGSALNSGVYFYKLTTGTFTETKKMLLLK